MAQSSSLTFRTKLGFAAGDFGFNLMFSGLGLYLLFYYTDVLGIPAATAGLTFMGALIWDGISDPLMGWLAQRTRSRWGSYRPYLIFASLPLAISFVLMYWGPDLAGNALVLFVFATHLLFRTVYTVGSIPYSSLMARITDDSMQRNSLAAFRMVGATLGAMTVAFTTLKLAAILGDGDMRLGFRYASMGFAAFTMVLMWVTFATTEESVAQVRRPNPSFADILRMLKANKPFLLVFGAILIGSSCTTLFSKSLVYYFKYNLGQEASIGLAMALFAGTIAALTPFWSWVTTKTSKRTVWLSGSGIFAVGLILFSVYQGQQLNYAIGLVLLCSIGAAAFPLTFWSMLPDTVEYGEWKSGVRAESFIFGLVSLAQKVALGIAVGMLGFILEYIGFQANTQLSSETLQGIRYTMTWIPIGGLLIGCSLIAFYRLDAKRHDEIVTALASREPTSNHLHEVIQDG